MKRAPYNLPVVPSDSDPNARKYWRSLDELANTPEFQEAVAREFPDGASESTGVDRRNFLTIMGASIGLAGLSGCIRRPEEKILPYSRAPEQVVPGRPEYYATSMAFGSTAIGLVVESHEGRPTKIEGNALHPDSLGGTHRWVQPAVLELYDPDRSDGPKEKGQKRTWDDAKAALAKLGESLKQKRGAGLLVVTREHRSPTTAAALAELKAQLPEARVVRWQPFSAWASREGARTAFGKPVEALYETGKADVLLTLDADAFLYEGRPIRQARGFADGRRLAEGRKEMNRLYAVESSFTITGATADHRLRLHSRDVAAFTALLAKELGAAGVSVAGDFAGADLGAPAKKFAAAVAKDLARAKGKSLVIAGERQPPAVHAACHAINVALGNVGQTVEYVRVMEELPEGPQALADAIKAGPVETVLVLGSGNPVLDAPADLAFADVMSKATSIHVGHFVDETGLAATWHINRAHDLESWSDTRAADGTAAPIQPLIAPMFDGRTDAEVIDALVGAGRRAHDLVRATWQKETSGFAALAGFEPAWRKALHDGVIVNSRFPSESVSTTGDVAGALKPLAQAAAQGYEVTFQPDSHGYDGRFANNAWLMELPDPMSKLTWDNAAFVSTATAKELGVEQGDLIDITVDGKSVRFPVVLQPGQTDKSIAITVGLGRKAGGRVGSGVGFDAYPIRSTKGLGFATAQAKATGERHKLAHTHGHHLMEGRPIVREADLTRFIKEPEFAKKAVEHPPLFNSFHGHEYNGHRWGMTIDLNACIGCGGCTVACQAENNIPVVGKAAVIQGREMHWIRIDRYYTGDPDADTEAVMQPVGCQHCENAPCEQVCPVGATTHSPEGLNDMAYNRCIGTRYCANNCPYKVRRFNYFNFAKDVPGDNGDFFRPEIPEIKRMQFNPNVSIRSRGVMEKCTYCVQRINEAKISAHKEGRERLRDGEVQTACQQGCPTNAIAFGDLNDPKSEVLKLASEDRSYSLLEELNVRPRTSYLARIRNPNKELA